MAKTLQQFREWAVKSGSVSNPTANTYRGQCVSLVQCYLNQVFNVPYKARGNAKDFVPPTFKRVSSYKPGDIIRYGRNYGGGYGHIGLIDDTGAFLDQNGVVALRVGRRSKPFGGIESIWRPTKKFTVKTAKPKTATKRVAQKGTFKANYNLNIRRSPSLKGAVAGVLKKGQTVKYDSYIDREGIRFISYIGYSGKRNYIARRTLNNKTIYGSAK